MAGSISAPNKTRRYKPPLPVDGGWAWLIMVAGYVNVMLAVAFGRTLSILLPHILEHYQKPATVTTLAFGIGDLSWSVATIALPTLLLPHFSVRSLALVGTFAHCLGVIVLAYSPNIIVFNCIFVVFGFAGGLMIVLPQIHLGHFFKKRLSFASAVIHAGGSTAAVIVPKLAQFLLDKYGYQGTLLILAGLSFNSVAASMLLRPLSMYDDDKSTRLHSSANYDPKSSLYDIQMQSLIVPPDEEQENEESKFLDNEDPTDKQRWNGIKNGNLQNGGKDNPEETKPAPRSEAGLTKSIPKNIAHNEFEILSLLPKTQSCSSLNHRSGADIINVLNSGSFNKDDYLSNSGVPFKHNGMEQKYSQADECVHCSNDSHAKVRGTNQFDHQICRHISGKDEDSSSQDKDFFHEPPDCGSKHIQEKEADVSPRWSMRKIKASLLSSVLFNPVAVMLIFAGGLSTPGGNMYMPVLGLENGLSADEVPWMLTIIGVADIVGKLGIGYFADLGYLRQIRIVCMTQFSAGMICQFTMFYKGFGPMAAMATVYGMTAGIIQALLGPMIIEMVGLEHLAQATSFFYLTTGMFTFCLNVSFGAIRDATSSFVFGYNLLGGMFLTSLVILLLEPVFVKCRDRSGNHSRDSHKKSARTQNGVI